MTPIPSDPSSYANVDAFVATHLVLNLTADFESRTLAGSVELRLDRRDPSAHQLVLDTRDLAISRAEAAVGTDRGVRHRSRSTRPPKRSGRHCV